MSPKAAALYDSAKLPRVFFDFGDMRKANATGYFPYTPALPMLYGLRESLAMLFEEGLENVFARHHRLAEGTRAAIKAWGLELCARQPKWHSDTVSAILVPADINAAQVIDIAYRRYNLALGAGLARMAGEAVPDRPPRRPERMHAARRHRRRGDGDARRGHQDQGRQRGRRGGGILARARPSRWRSASCRRARRTPSPRPPRRRRRPPPAPGDEPHARRARAPAAAAERARGAGLAIPACS